MSELVFQNVNQTFFSENGKIEVLNDINFNLDENEIIAIVGPSGCGKSTILNLICGLIKPTSGNIISNKKIVESKSYKNFDDIDKENEKKPAASPREERRKEQTEF